MIGQFVKIEVGGESRPYNPVSRIDEPGSVDFFIKDMRKDEKGREDREDEKDNAGNSFTHRLLKLKVPSA